MEENHSIKTGNSELEKRIQQLVHGVSKQSWIALISAFVIGILDYMYMFTNRFLTFDSMWNMYSDQDMITSGRQFLKWACGISSYFDLPAVNGILAIIYLSVTAAILVHVFEIKGYFASVLAGGIFVTFPAISSAFCYTYTIDGYMLAVLITTVAFVLMDRYRFGWIPAILLIGFSLGVYQAYYPFLIIICVLKLITDLVRENDLKQILKKALRYMLAGVGGYLFYAVSLKIMLSARGLSLSGYQGSDKVLGFDLREVPVNCYKAARNFFSFVFSMNILTATRAMKYGLIVLFLVAAVSFIYLLVVRRVYKKPVRILLIAVLLLCVPTLSSLAMVMAPEGYLHVMMRLPWSLFFLYAIFLVERAAESLESGSKEGLKKVSLIACCVFSACVIIMIEQFFVMQGIVAFNMQEKYEKTYFLCQSLMERLDQQDEYRFGDPVTIIGGKRDPNRYPSTSITEWIVGWYLGVNGELCVGSTEQFEAFTAHYLGVAFVIADDATTAQIAQTKEYEEMKAYPDAECIQRINGVWTIKLTNTN